MSLGEQGWGRKECWKSKKSEKSVTINLKHFEMTFAEDEMPSDQEIIDVRWCPNLVLLLLPCRCLRCCLLVRSSGVIWIRISDSRSVRSWYNKGTDESTLIKDSSVPVMNHDLSDLAHRSWSRLPQINARFIATVCCCCFVVISSGTCLFVVSGKRFWLIFVC